MASMPSPSNRGRRIRHPARTDAYRHRSQLHRAMSAGSRPPLLPQGSRLMLRPSAGTRGPFTAGCPSGCSRNATSRFCASRRKTLVGDCSGYASNGGVELFMIDCQNRFTCSAVAAAAGPDAATDRKPSAAGLSRYPVVRAPRAHCQPRIAGRVCGPNSPSVLPGLSTVIQNSPPAVIDNSPTPA